MTDIPAKTPRPIGRTDILLPGTWNLSGGVSEACSAGAAEAEFPVVVAEDETVASIGWVVVGLVGLFVDVTALVVSGLLLVLESILEVLVGSALEVEIVVETEDTLETITSPLLEVDTDEGEADDVNIEVG